MTSITFPDLKKPSRMTSSKPLVWASIYPEAHSTSSNSTCRRLCRSSPLIMPTSGGLRFFAIAAFDTAGNAFVVFELCAHGLPERVHGFLIFELHFPAAKGQHEVSDHKTGAHGRAVREHRLDENTSPVTIAVELDKSKTDLAVEVAPGRPHQRCGQQCEDEQKSPVPVR